MTTEAQILSELEPLLAKFRAQFPTGRIAADIKFLDPGNAGVKVSVHKDVNDSSASASAVASAQNAQTAQYYATIHALKLLDIS